MVNIIGAGNHAGDSYSRTSLYGSDYPSAMFIYAGAQDNNCKRFLKDDDIFFAVYFLMSIIIFVMFAARNVMMSSNGSKGRYTMHTRQGKFEISLAILTFLYFLTFVWEISSFAVLHIGCKDFMRAFEIGYDSEEYLKKANNLAYASLVRIP